MITTGGAQTCAVTNATGAECWGLNTYGQVGDGTNTTRIVPVAVSGLPSGVLMIAAGGFHTCALLVSGGVDCWGYNASGELGNGSTSNSNIPAAVIGLGAGATVIAAGLYHSCVALSGGSVQCWGYNNYGQLGNGTTANATTPVAVQLGIFGTATTIAAGAYHACAVTSGGAAICWGNNGFGQLGVNTNSSPSTTPLQVSGLSSGVSAIATGMWHTCALTMAGGVLCWGENNYGQLGNGTTSNSTIPVAVSGLSSGVLAIATGAFHSCAVLSNGAVQCWGYNANGALGNGATSNSPTPVTASQGLRGATVSAGGDNGAGADYTCALTAAGGAALCWGYNTYGELGNNDSNGVQSDVPVSVYGLSCGGSAASSDAPLPVWALGLLALMLLIIAYQKLRHVKPAAS